MYSKTLERTPRLRLYEEIYAAETANLTERAFSDVRTALERFILGGRS
jgi:hypothetical protein